MGRTYPFAGGWIAGLLLLLSPLGSSENHACQTPEPEGQREPKILERYRNTWEAHKGELDLAAIAALVADLDSKDTNARRAAFACLRQETALQRINWHYVFDPERDPAKQPHPVRDWREYARHLEVAVKEVVPLLLERPRKETETERGPRAFRVGLGAPHRAFLPLLREIVANPQETAYTRRWALRGLALIPHDGLIEYLVEQMDDQDLYWLAWNLIDRLTRYRTPRIQPRSFDAGEWKRAKSAFMEWWAKNRKDFKHNRSWVMALYC